MKSNVIKVSTPEAVAFAERIAQIKRDRRAASQKRWEREKEVVPERKPIVFNLKQTDV